MATWAIVPVKPLKRAKSRLASVLSREEREVLSRNLLIHTLEVLGPVSEIERTLVISRDPAALQIARSMEAYTITESGAPELNIALRRATDMAYSFGAQAVLVLPTDLPLMSVSDVCALLEAGNGPRPTVVVAPDLHAQGTNALFVRPPGLIQYQFGPNSLQAHVAQAKRTGARVRICKRPGLQLDIDVPADFASLHQSAARRFLST